MGGGGLGVLTTISCQETNLVQAFNYILLFMNELAGISMLKYLLFVAAVAEVE